MKNVQLTKISHLRYLVQMKHHISCFYNALLEHHLNNSVNLLWNIKFIKYRENKLIIIKHFQNVWLWPEHKHASVLAIGQLHYRSATAPSCTCSRRCRSSSMSWTRYHTHVAEWQTKWHSPPDLCLMSSVATYLVKSEWCIVAVQYVYHVRDGQARYPADT